MNENGVMLSDPFEVSEIFNNHFLSIPDTEKQAHNCTLVDNVFCSESLFKLIFLCVNNTFT